MNLKRMIKWSVIAYILITLFILIIYTSINFYRHYKYGKKLEPIPLSLIRLIANPSKFDGKVVITEGLLVMSDNSLSGRLYIDGDSPRNNMTYNSVDILISSDVTESNNYYDQMYNNLAKYNNNYIWIIGEFKFEQYPILKTKMDNTLEQMKERMMLYAEYYGNCHSHPKVELDGELCGPLIISIDDPSQK